MTARPTSSSSSSSSPSLKPTARAHYCRHPTTTKHRHPLVVLLLATRPATYNPSETLSANPILLQPSTKSRPLFTATAPPRKQLSAIMWDDEDNNPYGSFQRRDSEGSDIHSPGERELAMSMLQTSICLLAERLLTNQASTDRPPHHPRPRRLTTALTLSPTMPTSAMKNSTTTVQKVPRSTLPRAVTTVAFSRYYGSTLSSTSR